MELQPNFRGAMVTISPEGNTTMIALNEPPTLEALQAAVGGGLIQSVPGFETYEKAPCIAFCDEEGKLKGLPPNPCATAAWMETLNWGDNDFSDYLAGAVVIVVGEKDFLEAL